MRAPRSVVIATVLLAAGIGASYLSPQTPPPAHAVMTPAPLTVYSLTRAVQFCGAESCGGSGHLPDEVAIIVDPGPSAQVVGVWVIPSGKISISELDHFHALGFPDASKSNTAVVRFIHPSALTANVFEYTVLIKYLKAPTPNYAQ
ncbi:MAG TPA: hypothetical protein VJA16_05885 [Thermoanaerobaculia bacterium]